MAGMRIDPAWLEEEHHRDAATCFVCENLMEQPTSGCIQGHAACRKCYVLCLARKKECPQCREPTLEKKLVKCRGLEDVMKQFRLRCKNGPDDAGGGEGGAAPPAKRAKLEPAQSMSVDDLRKELGRRGLDTKGKKGELAARLEEHRRSDAGVEGAQTCSWRGRVCQLVQHLAESCGFEPVACPNAAAGCKESVLRKDAARHASETCAYRKVPCAHCAKRFNARALSGHEGSCPKAQIECPNAGCGVTVARDSIGEHRGGCGREEVGCPCPGCDERMARAEVEQHVEASGAVHVRRAWEKVAQMEEKATQMEEKVAEMEEKAAATAAEQANKVAGLEETVEEQADDIAAQKEEIAALRKRGDALTRVFTWSTDSEWSYVESGSEKFTGGVTGHCFSQCDDDDDDDGMHSMCFSIIEGPACTMHFKCSLLDKHDKVLRVVSEEERCDFREPPIETARVGSGMGADFDLTAADKAGAVRADGSIKLRMVVHLYLPE